jgi:hypothetical protein
LISNEPFRLSFDPTEISSLASRYKSEEDDEALAAGRRIAGGSYTSQELEIIFKWKTRNRGISRLHRNTPAEICDALRLATLAKAERCAVAVLTGLSGVDVPVASAVLTATYPDRYTVIDFRTLHALGNSTANRSLPFYLLYLDFCRKTSKAQRISLRDLDRALWQWSSERAQNGRRSHPKQSVKS